MLFLIFNLRYRKRYIILIRSRTYFANKKVLNAYDTKYLRAGIPRSQEVYFKAYDLTFFDRLFALFGMYRPPALAEAGDNKFAQLKPIEKGFIYDEPIKLKVEHTI